MCLLGAGSGAGERLVGGWELPVVVGWFCCRIGCVIGGRTGMPSPGLLDTGGRFARRALVLYEEREGKCLTIVQNALYKLLRGPKGINRP